jgi:hypothetical protein
MKFCHFLDNKNVKTMSCSTLKDKRAAGVIIILTSISGMGFSDG